MLTRNVSTRFEVSDNRRLTFYAAVFNEPATVSDDGKQWYRERIAPTAFNAALESNAEVEANVDHDSNRRFALRSTGELLLQPDPHGLFCSCWLPNTPLGESILTRVKAGELDGCSFRFNPVQTRTAKDGTIERVAVELQDVCLTSKPAYPQTKGMVMVRTDKLRLLTARYNFLKIRMEKNI